jgi:hypothetical protein
MASPKPGAAHPDRGSVGSVRIAEFTAMRDKDLAGRGDRFVAEGRVVLQALMDAEAGRPGGSCIEKALILENRIDGLGALIEPD